MSRATLVYLVMLVACAGGLWLILKVGAGKRAPVDLSGAWHVGGEDPAAAEKLGDTLAIEQSGRFLRLNFQHGLRVDVKLVDETAPDPAAGRRLDMIFEGPRWRLSAFGAAKDGPLIFRLTGPEKHTFTVSRPDGADEEEGEGESGSPVNTRTGTGGAGADARAAAADDVTGATARDVATTLPVATTSVDADAAAAASATVGSADVP